MPRDFGHTICFAAAISPSKDFRDAEGGATAKKWLLKGSTHTWNEELGYHSPLASRLSSLIYSYTHSRSDQLELQAFSGLLWLRWIETFTQVLSRWRCSGLPFSRRGMNLKPTPPIRGAQRMSARLTGGSGRLSWKLFLPSLALALAFIGMVLFSKGFLQVRKMVSERSQCSQRPASTLFQVSPKGSCWIPRPYRKLVVLVVDALRIDFVLPTKTPSDPSLTAPGWLGHLTVLDELARKDPLNANLFHFIADPPTATTQRLTGLTAGSLPAFIEVASNFAESSIGADNVIYQLLQNHREKLDLLGDDTWLHLFPEIQKDSIGIVAGFHSFHLFDLDSVDNEITTRLFPRLESGDYDVLIAHFLGVDHCGHKYGPAHAHCGSKLEQIDGIIRRVVETIDEDTQLLVLSDHGVTDDGDHGGISDKEVGSVLFAYKKSSGMSRDRLPEEEYQFWLTFKRTFNERRIRGNGFSERAFFERTCDSSSLAGTAPQLDFASTLSLLAGVPIPFGNIGGIILELLLDFDLYRDSELGVARMTNLQNLLEALRLNAHQVNRLLLKSSDLGQAGFARNNLRFLTDMLQLVEERAAHVSSASEDEIIHLIYSYQDFLLATQRYCRRVWADFNLPLIASGLTLGILAILGLLLYYLVLSWQNGKDLACITISLVHSLSLAATSFITFEDAVVRFLLTTQLLIEAVNSFLTGQFSAKRAARIAVAILFVRISSETGACREEQFPYCQVTTHRAVPVAFTPAFLYYLSIGVLGMSWIVRQTHVSLEEFKGTAKYIVSHLLYFLIFALLGLHWFWTWMADTSDATERSGSGPSSTTYSTLLNHMLSITLPRALFLLSLSAAVIHRRNGALLVTAVSAFLGTVLRPFGGWATLVVGVGLLRLGGCIFTHSSGSIRPATFYYLVGAHLFFISGHQMTLTNLQWEAAFVGVRTTIQSLAAILMALNTFAGPIMTTVALCSQVNSLALPANTLLVYSWYAACQMVFAALTTTILMRHLMVWKMFTPRFLLQVAQTALVLLVIGVCRLLRPASAAS